MNALQKQYKVYSAAMEALLEQQQAECDALDKAHAKIADVLDKKVVAHLQKRNPKEWKDISIFDVNIYYYDTIEVDGPNCSTNIEWEELE